MLECLIEGILDTIKIIPYLIITFILLELLEHKLTNKNKKLLEKGNRVGPLIGGLLGALPQCGFSTMASNLYASKVITTGTLISIFLATSDEMLPIMISENASISTILMIVGYKVTVGIIIGFTVDLFYKRKNVKPQKEIHLSCEHEKCHCEKDGIIKSSLIHTFKIALFILLVNISLNVIIELIGTETLAKTLLNNNILVYFISSLIGLIPNCASSVLITELYLQNIISTGTLIAGLLTGNGLGLLILFKTNDNKKENLNILFFIYIVGVLIGILTDFII